MEKIWAFLPEEHFTVKKGVWAALGRGSGDKGAVSALLSDIQSRTRGEMLDPAFLQSWLFRLW